MARRAFGRWGARLSGDEFAQALAALGVGETSTGGLIELAFGYRDRAIPWSLRELPQPADPDPHVLAEAWQGLLSDRPSSLRLAMGIWPGDSLEPAWLLQELGRTAVALDSVYLQAPPRQSGVAWRWPLQIAILDDGRSKLRQQLTENPPWLLAQLAEFVEAEAPVPCDLLLVPARLRSAVSRILTAPVKASAIVLLERFDEPWARAHALVDTLLMDAEAGAVAFARVKDDPAVWLSRVLEGLSHDAGLDVALFAAARALELPPPVVLAEQRLLAETRLSRVRDRMAREMRTSVAMANGGGAELESMAEAVESAPPFEHETAGASVLAEVSRESREILPPPEPRFLQAQVLEHEEEGESRQVRALIPSSLHEIRVRVGPPGGWWLADTTTFPEEELPPAEEHRLTVVLTEPYLLEEPQTAEILLRATGPSTSCSFWLQAPEEQCPLEARLIVLHEGRVLQTALLSGEVTSEEVADDRAIWFRVEALVHPPADLAGRTRFDAAFVVNHDREDVPRVTFIAGEHVDLREPQNIQLALEKINARLEDAVTKEQQTALDQEDMRKLMVFLAMHGSLLYQSVLDQYGGPLTEMERLQIVSLRPDAFLPLEFVYDRTPPDEEAKLCPNAKKALAEGKCDGCASLTDSAVVCPIGFWCLSKVIERQLHNRDVPVEVDGDYRVQSAPTAARPRLGELTSALFAASKRVDDFREGTIDEVVAGLESATGSAPTRAKTWPEWVGCIEQSGPTLLVLLPHTVDNEFDISTLEIEDGQQLGLTAIDKTYVGEKVSPIVVLLGCETADTRIPFHEFPAAFRRSGAAIVLGTLTKVLGRNAGPVATKIVASLAESAKSRQVTFGEVMRDVRRSFVAEGMPTILAVTAYGDADWILGPNGG